ncbi:MAG: PASTA domain-containing protein [Candidatus Zixiibacteriota bacterium]|nr:MAG: PASTA domain-containing protein [candidate division Zixibacteria bacterium]
MRRWKRPEQAGATVRVWRLRLLAGATFLLFLLFGVRLFYLQIIHGERYAQAARKQHVQKVSLASQRGRIVDRSGQELAVDLPQYYTVGVYPSKMTPSEANHLCQRLADFTGRPASHYLRRMQSRTGFRYLEWRLSEEYADELKALGLQGVVLERTSGRFYPYDRVTSQLLGYTDIEGHGISGLEIYCDSVLQGAKGWETRQRDGSGISFWDPLGGFTAPQDGGTVRTSIDIIAQEMLCQELDSALASTQAAWVAGLLVDPRTGEIIAMASLPDYDPRRPDAGDKTNHKMRPLTELMEPGSIFKIVAAAAALDQGLARPTDIYDCEAGAWRIGSRVLHDSHPYGLLSLEDVVVHSSNIGTAKIADQIGPRELYRYIVRFGFGTTTGIEFPGEGSGLLRPWDTWKDIGRANIAIGQGISVTMLQMAMSYAAIANDGILMEPRLILDWTDAGGQHHANPPREVRRVMEPETARLMQQILAQVVKRGTGRAAALDTVTAIAGKTGTAQLPNLETGGYYHNRYMASFIGFLPAHHADRVLIVTVCDPKGAYYGAQVAAPVFRRVLTRLQPADAVRRSWEAEPADLVEIPACFEAADSAAGEADAPALAASGLSLSNISRTPPAAKPDANPHRVPDLTGLTLREAVRRLTARGIRASFSGSGLVISQSLTPGEPVVKNSSCIIIASSEIPVDSVATGGPDTPRPPQSRKSGRS